MKSQGNYFLVLCLLQPVLNQTLAMAEGSGHSGGGSGIVLKSGTVLFADLTDPTKIELSQVATADEVKNIFFKNNRFVKTMAVEAPTFFDCAIPKISNLNVSFQEKWISAVKAIHPLKVEFPLNENASQTDLEKEKLPVSADANTHFSNYPQVALAAYSKGDLWIQRRLTEKNVFSDEAQCALSVHEALRALNFSLLTHHHLSTSEIEVATAQVMDGNYDAVKTVLQQRYVDQSWLPKTLELKNKLDDLQKDMEKLSQNADLQAFPDFSAQFTKANVMLEGLRRPGEITSFEQADSQNIFANQIRFIGQKTADYLTQYIEQMSKTEIDQIAEAQSKSVTLANAGYTASEETAFSSTDGIRAFTSLDRAQTKDMITHRLSAGVCYDVFANQFISR